MKESVGHLQGKGLKIAIVVSRFNELITKSLLAGSLDALTRHGVKSDDIHVVWVPGAFEIPLVAKKLASSNSFNAIICLGAVIRGATPHFEYVSSQAASGIASVALESEMPVLFGILTTETIDQAIERAGTKCGNKGFDMGVSAIEMANLLSSLN